MYKIIGTDQQEYGPVTGSQLREWIAQGRATAQTQVQAEGSAGWRPLSAYPEFADALTAPSPAATPAALATAAAPAALAGAHRAPLTHPGLPPKTSGMAIASLVLGVLGPVSCGLTALAGLVLGIISLGKIKRSGGQIRGHGLALAGTIVSGVALLFLPVMAGLLLPALAKAKTKSQAVMCMTNLKQLNLGLMMYANDHKDQFPAGDNWCDAIQTYVSAAGPFKCILGDPNQRSHYAFNGRLAGTESKKVQTPAQTVMVFETQGGWNVSGGPELVLAKGRHSGAIAIGFADGHVEVLRPEALSRLRWDP